MSVYKCSKMGCSNPVPRGRDICDECARSDLTFGFGDR